MDSNLKQMNIESRKYRGIIKNRSPKEKETENYREKKVTAGLQWASVIDRLNLGEKCFP